MSDKGEKDANAPFLVHMYKNGDAFSRPTKVLVVPGAYKDFETFLDLLTSKANMIRPVMKVYSTRGGKIKSIDDLEEKQEIVVTDGKEKFIKCDYGGEQTKTGWNTEKSFKWVDANEKENNGGKKKKKKRSKSKSH